MVGSEFASLLTEGNCGGGDSLNVLDTWFLRPRERVKDRVRGIARPFRKRRASVYKPHPVNARLEYPKRVIVVVCKHHTSIVWAYTCRYKLEYRSLCHSSANYISREVAQRLNHVLSVVGHSPPTP